MRVGRRVEALYQIEKYAGRPVVRCWAGLTPVVLTALAMERRRPRFLGGLYHAVLPPPEAGRRGSATDAAFIELVARHDRGLIRHRTGAVDPVLLLAQLARAWPDRTLAAVVARRDDAVATAKRLRADGVDAFGFTARNEPVVQTRVVVSTTGGLANGPLHPARYDIFVALDALSALGKDALWCIGHLDAARLYGFLPIVCSPSPYERDLLHCLFGFHELVIPHHGLTMRTDHVARARSPGYSLRWVPKNVLELKRHGIWNQERRNRQIARLARAFASDDKAELARLLPSVPATALPSKPRRVLVLVENLEHALKLMNKLPDWAVYTSRVVELKGLPQTQLAGLTDRTSPFSTGPASHGITTPAGMRTFNAPVNDADVLIRADAGVGMPGLPPVALVCPSDDPDATPLFVIDLDDRHHPELRHRTRQRRRAYSDAEWPAPGVSTTTLRVVRFLKARLKGGRP